MKSIKPGRGPSMMGGIMSIVVGLFGVCLLYTSAYMQNLRYAFDAYILREMFRHVILNFTQQILLLFVGRTLSLADQADDRRQRFTIREIRLFKLLYQTVQFVWVNGASYQTIKTK